jgi:hypothetical protein
MSTAPTLTVTLRYAGGPSFGPTLEMGSAVGTIGKGVFGGSTNEPIDITDKVQRVMIRRGRTRVLDKFEAGVASFDLVDETGIMDIDAGTYGTPKPMLQVRMWATYDGTDRFLFSGFTQEWDYRWRAGVDANLITVTCVDAFRAFTLSEVDAIAGTSAGQGTGARLDDILDDISWPTSVRDIDTGNTTVVDDDGTSRTALAAMQKVSEAELGGLWIDTDGDVRFMSRHNTIKTGKGTPTEFDDDGTNIAYQGIDFEMDDQVLINSASITRSGGSAQTASDATSITDFFLRSYKKTGMLMNDDTQALGHALSIVQARKDAAIRIKSITLDLTEDVAARVEAGLDLDFFSPIKVTRTAPGPNRVTRTLVVQGVQHQITPQKWTTTLNTAEPIADGFVLGTDKLGTGVLGY